MLRIRKRNLYLTFSEFYRGRIIAYRKKDYHSVLSPAALLNIHPLPCEYEIDGLLRIILNGRYGLNALSWQTSEKTDIV